MHTLKASTICNYYDKNMLKYRFMFSSIDVNIYKDLFRLLVQRYIIFSNFFISNISLIICCQKYVIY